MLKYPDKWRLLTMLADPASLGCRTMDEFVIRQAKPDDYDAIMAVVNDWWGRDVRSSVPRLFLDHFHATSLIAASGAELAGFLIGFHSPSKPREAYIHFVGVHPDYRKAGLASQLYEEFLSGAVRRGRDTVRAITSPVNEGSIAFHRRMGFEVAGPVPDYNGPGIGRITFTRSLSAG